MGSLDRMNASRRLLMDPRKLGNASGIIHKEVGTERVQVEKTFPHVPLQPEHLRKHIRFRYGYPAEDSGTKRVPTAHIKSLKASVSIGNDLSLLDLLPPIVLLFKRKIVLIELLINV